MNDYLRFRPRFEETMEPGIDSIEALDALLATPNGKLWIKGDTGLVTELIDYGGGERVVQALWAVGTLEDCMEIMPLAEGWGKDRGATTSMVHGRLGWLRALKKHGYEPFSVSVRKAL